MATPLTADQLLDALETEGAHVVAYKQWGTHDRNSVGPWGPVNGVMIHHTAGTNSLSLCYDGRADLPGPLCHTHLSKGGTATMLSAGRANHAGTIAQNAHDAVVSEAGTHPKPDEYEPVDGNQHYYGLEIENLGKGGDPYPAVQYEAAVRWAAGICRAHGWSEHSVIGHREGTRRKIDPSFDMVRFRADVADRLARPKDDPKDDDVTALTTEQANMLEGLYKALVQPTIPTRVPGAAPKSYTLAQHVAATNGKVMPGTPEILARLGFLEGQLDVLTASVEAALADRFRTGAA